MLFFELQALVSNQHIGHHCNWLLVRIHCMWNLSFMAKISLQKLFYTNATTDEWANRGQIPLFSWIMFNVFLFFRAGRVARPQRGREIPQINL
ncbi:unnamed protein product [Tetraodon nigroviridis]|uniref:Chromosome undetermined SCAF10148, whole genome shotgun sequence n=1 Tax=Tetraodon nigroviridis TaxID=99883 RepID=Q4T2Z2_TETNG|nr:unnamed protein product [Tetraodon nigroviridis]